MNFGLSVAMSNDGNVIAVATQERNDASEDGVVFIYELTGNGIGSNLTYTQRGSNITLNGIDDMDTFGASISLNADGSVIAIASGSLDTFNGHAYIYKYLNSEWKLIRDIPGSTNENLGGIHNYDINNNHLISDEDGICLDATGNLVAIGAPNLYSADNTDSNGNGSAYLYRNQTYTLGVNDKLQVKGDIVIDNGDIDVDGNIIVSGSRKNNIISSALGIGNHFQSTGTGSRNVFEGGSNYIYSQEMNNNGATGGHNRLYATQAYGYNDINATGLGGANYIEANETGSNRLKVNGNDKIVTEASTTTLTNTNINIVGDTDISGNLTVPIIQGIAETNLHKIRLYGDTNRYSIGFSDASGTKFGGLFYNAMTFTMNDDLNSGFIWRDNVHNDNLSEGAMSLSTDGRLTVASNTRIGYGETTTTDHNTSYMLDVSGNVNFDDKIVTNTSTTTLTNTNNKIDVTTGWNQLNATTGYNHLSSTSGYNQLSSSSGYNIIKSNRTNNTANDIYAGGSGGRNIIRCLADGYNEIQVDDASKIKVENATTTLSDNIVILKATDVNTGNNISITQKVFNMSFVSQNTQTGFVAYKIGQLQPSSGTSYDHFNINGFFGNWVDLSAKYDITFKLREGFDYSFKYSGGPLTTGVYIEVYDNAGVHDVYVKFTAHFYKADFTISAFQGTVYPNPTAVTSIPGTLKFSSDSAAINAPINVGNLSVNGNVGIGTTNPGAKLDVNGDVNFDDKIVTEASTTTLTNTNNTLTATTQNKLTSSRTTEVGNYITVTGGGG